MDMIEAFQEYFFKKIVKTNGGDNASEIGCLHRGSTRSYSCGCGGAARKRDCSTSSHDLSTYVWCTEGDGVGMSTSIRTDDDDCSNCQTGSTLGRKQGSVQSQSKSGKTEPRGNVCDASTSTFDLTTHVWGTEGHVYRTDFDFDEGDMDNAGRGSGGLDRKRPRAASPWFFIPKKSEELPATPRKKKRRIGNEKD